MSTPTGEQFELAYSGGNRQSRAIITEVAAGIRALEIDGVAVVESYPEHSLPPYGSGITLAPWPNRVEDGVWIDDGARRQLDLTEPDKGNAIHGLLRNTAYRLRERSECSVTLAAVVYPQHGYPYQLDTAVTHRLDDDGMTVTHEIVNLSDAAAPVAVGAHPYLRLGDIPLEELTLELAATTHFEVSDRQNARDQSPVDGTALDLRAGRVIGDLQLDDGFGGVPAGAVHRLVASDGRYVELWRDPEFAYVQVFTNREFPKNGGTGLAVAVEPMTAPANALNTGLGVRRLEQGERMTVSWGIRYSGGPAGE